MSLRFRALFRTWPIRIRSGRWMLCLQVVEGSFEMKSFCVQDQSRAVLDGLTAEMNGAAASGHAPLGISWPSEAGVSEQARTGCRLSA